MKKIIAVLLAIVCVLSFAACDKAPSNDEFAALNGIELKLTEKQELLYAKHFEIYDLESGYTLLATYDDEMKISNRILVVPEGKEAVSNLPADVFVVKAPITDMFLSSTPSMSLLNAIDSVGSVSMTTHTSTWYIDAVNKALDSKAMIDVGSYKTPDYELITKNMPNLGVFSTMITEQPKVMEQLKILEVPYIVDQSTCEPTPLGRTEWIKFYGVLTNKKDAAEKFFNEQNTIVEAAKKSIANIKDEDKKSVLFFYVTSKGSFNLRSSDDYLSNAIAEAGGKGIFPEGGQEGKSSVTVTKEVFYDLAVDADVIIYNYSLGGKFTDLKGVESRVGDILYDFKAVKEGNVFATSENFYQVTDTIGQMIGDLNLAFYGENVDKELSFLNRLK